MYYTGDYDNIEGRMHATIQSGADIDAYAAEANSYSGVSGFMWEDSALPRKWARELHYKYREINGSGYSGHFLSYTV